MPRKCVVDGCTTKSGQNISLFEFPVADLDRRRLWTQNVRVSEDILTGGSAVCKLHFEEKYISRQGLTRVVLTPNAVPTIFPWSRHSAVETVNLDEAGSSFFVSTPSTPDSSPQKLETIAATPQRSPDSETEDTPIGLPPSTGSMGTAIGSIYKPTPEQEYVKKSMSENYQPPGESTFIIAEECLRELFCRCSKCGKQIDQEVRFYKRGAHLRVEYYCDVCGAQNWQSSSFIQGMSKLNLTIPSSIVTAGNTFQDFHDIADGLQLGIMGDTEFYDVCRVYVYPTISSVAHKYQSDILETIRIDQRDDEEKALKIAIDTRFSQVGHSAKLATTSAIDLETKKIITSINTQKGVDAPSSAALELAGTKIILNSILKHGGEYDPSSTSSSSSAASSSKAPVEPSPPKVPLRISTLVTDEHTSIIAEMKKDPYKDIRHQSDVWHFTKRVKKRLAEARSVAVQRELSPWIKSITNFVWLICNSCQGDPDILEQLWKSVLFHVTNKHSWEPTEEFDAILKCRHGDLDLVRVNEIGWLKEDSRAYAHLKAMVYDKRMITSLRRCCDFLQTSEVESFHSLLLKFVPKRLAFEKDSFDARTKMAILDFNENISRPISRTATGSVRTRLDYSKHAKTWVAKSKFVDRTENWRQEIMHEVVQARCGQASTPGHRLQQRTLWVEPSQRSLVQRPPPREELDENFKKRRRMDE